MSGHRVPRRRTKISGLLGPVLLTPLPARIEGADQRGGDVKPPTCPHCHAEPPMWVVDRYSGSCRACGATWYHLRHSYRIPTPRHGNPHPVTPR